MSSMFCASSRKSSSSTIVSANSSMSAGGLASAATGMRPMRCGASHDIASMSSRTRRAICGRCTLTTTSSPVRSRAACTCAIDAAAIGVRSNEANTSSSDRPSSSSTTRRTSSNGSGGTRSRSSLNSATSSSGNRPFAAGDDLAELDVGRSEVPEGDAQPAGQVTARVRRALAARAHGPQAERGADPTDDAAPDVRAEGAGRSPSTAGIRPGPGPGAGRRRARHVIASGSTTQGP